MKLYKIFALAVVLSFATCNNTFANSAENTLISQDNSKTILVKVKGAGCSKDLKAISTNLENLKGVDECTIKKKGATTTFEVKYNASLVTTKEIYAAVENTAGCTSPDNRPFTVKR